MKNQTQADWVFNELEKYGEISRNKCLRKYISRLGAIIFDLKKLGHKIEGEFKKTKNGRDYVYKLIK